VASGGDQADLPVATAEARSVRVGAMLQVRGLAGVKGVGSADLPCRPANLDDVDVAGGERADPDQQGENATIPRPLTAVAAGSNAAHGLPLPPGTSFPGSDGASSNPQPRWSSRTPAPE